MCMLFSTIILPHGWIDKPRCRPVSGRVISREGNTTIMWSPQSWGLGTGGRYRDGAYLCYVYERKTACANLQHTYFRKQQGSSNRNAFTYFLSCTTRINPLCVVQFVVTTICIVHEPVTLEQLLQYGCLLYLLWSTLSCSEKRWIRVDVIQRLEQKWSQKFGYSEKKQGNQFEDCIIGGKR